MVINFLRRGFVFTHLQFNVIVAIDEIGTINSLVNGVRSRFSIQLTKHALASRLRKVVIICLIIIKKV